MAQIDVDKNKDFGETVLKALEKTSSLCELSPIIVWKKNHPYLLADFDVFMPCKLKGDPALISLRKLFQDNPKPMFFTLKQMNFFGERGATAVAIPEWW